MVPVLVSVALLLFMGACADSRGSWEDDATARLPSGVASAIAAGLASTVVVCTQVSSTNRGDILNLQ